MYATGLQRVNLTPVGVYPRNPSIITRYISAKERNVFPRPGCNATGPRASVCIYIHAAAPTCCGEGVSIKLLFKYSVTYIYIYTALAARWVRSN